MYIGHFAAGLAIRAKAPNLTTAAILIGVGLLDFLYAMLLAMHVERASKGAFDFIDWSHSMLMAIAWSVLFALLFFRKGYRAMLPAALAVFSHFLLDVIAHRPDLALYPHSPVHLGMAGISGAKEWWIELALSLFFCCFYLQLFSKKKRVNLYSIGIVMFLMALHIVRKLLGM